MGERLIEGVQGSPSDNQAQRVGCISQFTGSWPSGLSGLGSSEARLYKGMRLDRASDEDYVPSSVVVDDVAMSLGDNKTSELNGLGDGRHAGPCASDKKEGSDSLLSTVPYSLSATQDILGTLAEYEMGTITPRPAELDSCDGSLDFMDEVEQLAQVTADAPLSDHDRIVRLEKAVEEERDLFDRLRDIVEDLKVHASDLTKWKNDVMENGCSRCHDRSGPKKRSTDAEGRKNSHPAGNAGTSKAPATVAGPSALAAVPPPFAPPFVSRLVVSRLAGVAHVAASPAIPAVGPRIPTYASSDEARATKSFAAVAAANASTEGYNIVKGRKRFMAKEKKTPVPVTSIPARAQPLTIRFERDRDIKYSLPKGVTIGRIRDSLNTALFALNCGAYFSQALIGEWGDVLLTLAATEVEHITGYYPPMREALDSFGLGTFMFVRDTEKVKVFVGMLPLSRFGGSWQPSDWEGRTAFDYLAADIENSNPGVVVAARPSWAGRLHKLKERRANNAGLILVLEMTKEVWARMGAAQPRITVAGWSRMCRAWRDDNPTIVCSQCQTVGHRPGECKNTPVCAFCHGSHLTSGHTCPVLSCKKVGTVCTHVSQRCILCHSGNHFTGHRECAALGGSSSSPEVLGPATPVVADHSSVVGVSDQSRGRLQRQDAGRPGTPLAPHMINNGVSSKGITRILQRSEVNPDQANHSREVVIPALDKGKGVARSPSTPADISRVGGNGLLSAW